MLKYFSSWNPDDDKISCGRFSERQNGQVWSVPLLIGADDSGRNSVSDQAGRAAGYEKRQVGKTLMTIMPALRLSVILALNKLGSDSGGHSGTTNELINVLSCVATARTTVRWGPTAWHEASYIASRNPANEHSIDWRV